MVFMWVVSVRELFTGAVFPTYLLFRHMMLLPVICLTLCVLTREIKAAPQRADKHPTPVVLVPGVFGSQLDGWYKKDTAPHYYCSKDSGGWTRLWLCIECMVPTVLGCWTDNFSLNITDLNDIKNRDGVQTKVNDFGYTDGISYLDSHQYVVYFEELIKGIAALPGYFRGQNIRGAPYDSRYPPTSRIGEMYMIKLQKLIEETYLINYNTKVMVVAHSMGNPMMVYFLKRMTQAWKDQFIDSFVALNGVFGGSAKAIRALASGETEGLPGLIVDPLTMRAMERSLPTVYWLLPSPTLFEDEVFVITDTRNYTAHDFSDLMKDIGAPSGSQLLDMVKDIPLFDDDLGVDVHCMHGFNNTTPLQFQYAKGKFPDTFPTTVDGNGDGTVNLKSLQLCKKFKRLKTYKIFTGPLSKHLEILQNQDVISEVIELLYISQLKRTEGLERREELELERREQLERREEKRGNGTSQDTLHF